MKAMDARRPASEKFADLKPTLMIASRYIYRVHGLVIASELEFPELAPVAPDLDATPDLNIRLAKLAPDLEMSATDIPDLFLSGDKLLLVVPGAARFAIGQGTDVTIEMADSPDIALLRLFFFGSVMGLVCHQRGLLPLHASAVAFDGEAIAFCGPPGMGKSTLAAFCVEAGARLVADDVLVVSMTGSGSHAVVNPGMPKVKLWRDALEALGRNTEGLSPDWARAEKFHVPAGPLTVTEPVRLSRIFILDVDENAGAGVMSALSGAQAVSELIQNTYRPEYLDVAHRRTAHFADCVRLSTLTPVIRLRRRRDTAWLMKTALMLMDRSSAQP
jgi:hypothetical protein